MMIIIVIVEMTDRSLLKHQLIPCLCGCGELIPAINKRSEVARYKYGHQWKGKHHTIESKKKISIATTREKNPFWKGGKTKINGYVLRRKYNIDGVFEKFVMDHRVIWEEHNNACLLPWGHVHHKNENRSDNRIENLQAMMNKDHGKLHGRPKHNI